MIQPERTVMLVNCHEGETLVAIDVDSWSDEAKGMAAIRLRGRIDGFCERNCHPCLARSFPGHAEEMMTEDYLTLGGIAP